MGKRTTIQQQQRAEKKRIPSDLILHSVAAIAVIVVASVSVVAVVVVNVVVAVASAVVVVAAVIASIAVVRVSWPFYTLS